MSDVLEMDLPGIGKKFTLSTAAGATITVISHLNGRRDIYYVREGRDDEVTSVFSLTDEEARKLSAVLGDTFFKPTPIDILRTALASKTQIGLVKVASASPAAGKTLRELDVRRQTGASVLAIQRGDQTLPNPAASTIIEGGDLLIIMGTEEELKRLERLVEKG